MCFHLMTRSMARRLALIGLVGLLLFAVGCSSSETSGECDHSDECESPLQCIDSTCQSLDDYLANQDEPDADVAGADTSTEMDASNEEDVTDEEDVSEEEDVHESQDVGVDCRVEPCDKGLLCDESTGLCEPCVLDEQCQEYAVCDGETSRCTCIADYQYCDGECLSLDSVESCGSECVPCPDVDNGAPACIERTCGAECDDGFYYCDEDCDGDEGQCVECLENEHCTDPDAPFCDAGSCAPCTDSAHCSHNPDRPVCHVDSGRCVECTMEELDACGTYSCHPDDQECTQTPRGSVSSCRSCLSDSECTTDHHCVPMEFEGTPRESAYCLKLDSAGCESPFEVLVIEESVSGAEMEIYCGINEELTTCEAVHDYDSYCGDPSGEECGHPDLDDALCESIEFEITPRCTYRCDSGGYDECVNEGFGCATGTQGFSFCGAW